MERWKHLPVNPMDSGQPDACSFDTYVLDDEIQQLCEFITADDRVSASLFQNEPSFSPQGGSPQSWGTGGAVPAFAGTPETYPTHTAAGTSLPGAPAPSTITPLCRTTASALKSPALAPELAGATAAGAAAHAAASAYLPEEFGDVPGALTSQPPAGLDSNYVALTPDAAGIPSPASSGAGWAPLPGRPPAPGLPTPDPYGPSMQPHLQMHLSMAMSQPAGQQTISPAPTPGAPGCVGGAAAAAVSGHFTAELFDATAVALSAIPIGWGAGCVAPAAAEAPAGSPGCLQLGQQVPLTPTPPQHQYCPQPMLQLQQQPQLTPQLLQQQYAQPTSQLQQQQYPQPPLQPQQQQQPACLASELQLKAEGQQPAATFRCIGELLFRGPDVSLVHTYFLENPDPTRQFAFWAVGGKLPNERSDLGGTSSGRQPQPVTPDGSVLVACLTGTRCTCGKTPNKECEAAGHPHDKVAKYFLVYRDPPMHGTAKQKPFSAGKHAAGEINGRVGNAKKSVAKLWVPDEPPAVLWHIRPRTGGSDSLETPARCGSADAAAAAAAASPTVAALYSAPGAGSAATEMRPTAGSSGGRNRSPSWSSFGAGTASPTAAAAAGAAARNIGAIVSAKRARTAAPAASPSALVPAATRPHQHQAWLGELQPEQLQPAALQALQGAGRPGTKEVQEPWLGSLERILQYLRNCGTLVAPGAAAEVFELVLAGIPGEHLREMRCPRGGGGLAHLLVTPPQCLLAEDDGGPPPPQDPNNGLPESEAVEMIQAVVERLAAEAGGSMEVARQQWSEMLGAVDDRYGATAVHRAGRYGHRLRVLEEWVLPYASRADLLQPTPHIYLCYHSAARSGHEQAANLLLAAVSGALQDLARAPGLQPKLRKLLLPSVPASASATLLPDAAAALEFELISKCVYTLKNKFFTGRNASTEGFLSPPGRSGHDLLTRGCAAARWWDHPQETASQMPYMGQFGPQRPLPSPASPDKSRTAALLGGIRFAAMELDESQPRLLQLCQDLQQ